MALDLVRRPDWEARLVAFLDAHATTPFSWAGHCCVRHAGGAIAAMCDVDPLEGLGVWSNPESARTALRAQGGLGRGLADRLPEIAPAFARRGDLALVRASVLGHGRQWLVGVVMTNGVLAPATHGQHTLPRAGVVRAFAVG